MSEKQRKMWLNIISISLYDMVFDNKRYVLYWILCPKCWHCCELRPRDDRTQTRGCCLATATTFHICWLPSTLLFSVCCDVCLLSMRSTREWKRECLLMLSFHTQSIALNMFDSHCITLLLGFASRQQKLAKRQLL